MIKYHIFCKTDFDKASKIGTATEFSNGTIHLDLRAIPVNGSIVLVPERTAQVVPIKPKLELVR